MTTARDQQLNADLEEARQFYGLELAEAVRLELEAQRQADQAARDAVRRSIRQADQAARDAVRRSIRGRRFDDGF
jgi:hypothetical protein